MVVKEVAGGVMRDTEKKVFDSRAVDYPDSFGP
jgi:hypothetical protein